MKLSRYTRAWSIFWGIVMVICGGMLIWGNQVSSRIGTPLMERLAEMVEEVDASRPDPSFNGRVVLVSAPLEARRRIEDKYLGPGDWVYLEREIEMFQWYEETTPVAEGGARFEYKLGWFSEQKDFLSFHEPFGHENPALLARSSKIFAPEISLGGFDGRGVVEFIVSGASNEFVQSLELTPDQLRPGAQPGEDRWIYVRKDPTKTVNVVGDLRVRYRGIPAQKIGVVARQNETTQLLPGQTGEGEPFFLVKKDANTLADFFADEERGAAGLQVVLFGVCLMFGGFLSVLLPVSGQFNLEPTINLRGRAAATALSAFASIVITVLLLISALFKSV
jgi:Transmembrane protein 43